MFSAVKFINEQGYSAAAAARSPGIGVDPSDVRQWQEKFGPEAQPVG